VCTVTDENRMEERGMVCREPLRGGKRGKNFGSSSVKNLHQLGLTKWGGRNWKGGKKKGRERKEKKRRNGGGDRESEGEDILMRQEEGVFGWGKESRKDQCHVTVNGRHKRESYTI